jgi:hypothetical protein
MKTKRTARSFSVIRKTDASHQLQVKPCGLLLRAEN